jgi:hypothetical protein
VRIVQLTSVSRLATVVYYNQLRMSTNSCAVMLLMPINLLL